MAIIDRLFRLRPVTPDLLLRDGDRIGGLEVVHVPGHTAGSIALRHADGVLFSGDALLGDRHGGIGPPDPGLSLDPVQARASADKIRGLGFTLLLPGVAGGALEVARPRRSDAVWPRYPWRP